MCQRKKSLPAAGSISIKSVQTEHRLAEKARRTAVFGQSGALPRKGSMMNRFVNPDNPVLNFFGKLLDCIWLNVLWLVCCLPVVTAGASTTALYYCTLKLAEDRRVELTHDFFRAFKENLKEGTVLSLIFTGLGIILAIEGRLFWAMKTRSAVWTLGTAVFVLVVLVFSMVAVYVFPMLARFDNTWRNMVRNSFLISVRFMVCTMLLLIIRAAFLFVAVKVFAPILILGEGLIALLSSYLLKNVFAKVEESQEKAMGSQSGQEEEGMDQ